jgi:hypothetical protein
MVEGTASTTNYDIRYSDDYDWLRMTGSVATVYARPSTHGLPTNRPDHHLQYSTYRRSNRLETPVSPVVQGNCLLGFLATLYTRPQPLPLPLPLPGKRSTCST